ncbi:MAG TPA: hypothetical protein PKB00_05040 [Microthrixaceae bacterium]|nr:hypothetical protein [Microthrixaceae bacterium]
MPEPLPTLADLHPDEATTATEILNLVDEPTLQALINTIARKLGATPPAVLGPGEQPKEWVIRARRPYGGDGFMAISKDRFFADRPPRDAGGWRPWVVPALAAEENTPSGRRRVAVHLWRAVQQGRRG